ncbi:MAG TPA: alpha-L-arabinofuranosidase C-terminal domain-containing protein [Pyrinomonadaceae bacterium]|jgi:alpha-N-arabinofuranosidase|nr:alpha-L-arabinofuranosidase C-terminal domain-containing protein [Pyrinomonadaceae bacterium]
MRATRPLPPALLRRVAAVCALCLCLQAPLAAFGQSITVEVNRPGAAIPETLFGLFFEDINFGADGGLYPERVKNRSFEFADPLMGWKRLGGEVFVLDRSSAGAVANAHYVRLKVPPGVEGAGLRNEGFRGMGVREGEAYTFSLKARLVGGGPVTLRAELEDEGGKSLGRAQVAGLTKAWKKHSATLRASGTSLKAHLNLIVEGEGAVDVDVVSLYPKDTWMGRENGLRPDLVKLLKEMRPGFLRFPGGCIVEGSHLERRYQWKTTIGDPDERRLLVNRWNYEFRHKPAPDYYQSFGLGFYEYFLLSEDIGAEPLPILNCGMACQYNTGELAPLEDLGHYIQDALDLIAFANAPVSNPWGRRRAAMGHPRPFNLKMLGVGNEQWGPQYVERYKLFAAAIRKKHPEIKLVTSAGPSPEGERFDYLWREMRALKADIVDEHYYMAPAWFLSNAGRYDDYPRDGPKVFAGEYAAQSSGIAKPDNRNNWETALAEAAFMTGLERNSDVVVMSSYAPLLAHADAWQWTPDMIWFDNLRSYGTPNYYVQKLFATNLGTTTLPVLLNGSPKNNRAGLYASAALDAKTNEVVLKVVNANGDARRSTVKLEGAQVAPRAGRAIFIAGRDLKDENSFDDPTKVAPAERPLEDISGEFIVNFAPHSVTVLRVPVTRR